VENSLNLKEKQGKLLFINNPDPNPGYRSESGSEINAKAGSESGHNFGSTTQRTE
jgi:hypothetical protein